VKSIFSEGHFDAREDIRNPRQLARQIVNNVGLLSPDERYIGGKYSDINLDLLKLNTPMEGILYVYILGLEKELWGEEKQLEVLPQYWGTDGVIEITKATKRISFFKPIGESLKDKRNDETMSRWILNYFHLVRGLFIDETTFSKKKDLIYEPEIIESESGIFPWDKDDFDEGKPKREIDPLYNMSPVVFPRNYFYDVCLENKYQRVVGVALTKKDLRNLPIETLDPSNSLEDIIGSIRWVVKT